MAIKPDLKFISNENILLFIVFAFLTVVDHGFSKRNNSIEFHRMCHECPFLLRRTFLFEFSVSHSTHTTLLLIHYFFLTEAIFNHIW